MGGRVYFLNPPDDSAIGIQIEKERSYENLYVVSTGKVIPGLRFFPSKVRRLIENRWLEKFEMVAGEAIDTIWLFENSRFFDLGFAGDRLKIYHQVDLNQAFNPASAALSADICFCTTELIRERLVDFNRRVYKIHHGVAKRNEGEFLTRDQRARLKGNSIKAMYVGNLDMQFLDFELLYSVVKEFSNVDFHFVGGYRDDCPLRMLCEQLPNITWWGKVDSQLIPELLEMVDLLLVTYKAENWKDQASPHKFMEYLASGVVVVSTYTDEYKNNRNLLEMVDNSDEYVGAVQRVIDNLQLYNSPSKKAERRSFAQNNTYEKQISRIQGYLAKHDLGLLVDKPT